ncbi:MAG: diaminobutyrate acetyltransferase [Pseudohongiellaceae bacterium]
MSTKHYLLTREETITINDSKVFRTPNAADGFAINRLIERCPPLDTNSLYCNLLQCTHFAETSVLVEQQSEIVGLISGYLIPARTDTLFVWQVAVSDQCRGQGLASQMLENLLERPACARVAHLETTVTASNNASKALFQRLATGLNTELTSSILFDKNQHFRGKHESECLLHIGPFN